MKDFTWLQHVTFTYNHLCLFDNIRRTIHSQLPDDALVENIYNLINIHKCIIVPRYAIGTCFCHHFNLLRFIQKTNNNQTVFGEASQVFTSCTPTSTLWRYNKQDNTDCIREEVILQHQENQTGQRNNQNQWNLLQGRTSSDPDETELYYFED